MTDFIKIVTFGILLAIILNTNIANAGGVGFTIKIDNIETINEHKHIIYFKKLDKVGDYAYSYPLDNCENIKIAVNYRYKESWFRSIELFFHLLFGDNTEYDKGVALLNKNINILKNNLDKSYETDDIEAFKFNSKNNCELYTKTLEVYQEKPYFNELADFELRFILR